MFDAAGNTPVAFDAAAARKDLTAAGWKQSGNSWIPKGAKDPLVIELLSPEQLANPVAYAAADAVMDAWHAIGLAVRHVPLPAAELLGDRLARGEFQVAVLPFAIGLDPDVYPLLAASQTRTGGSNVIGLQDPDLDQLLVAARTPVRSPTGSPPTRRSRRGWRRAPTCCRWPSGTTTSCSGTRSSDPNRGPSGAPGTAIGTC